MTDPSEARARALRALPGVDRVIDALGELTAHRLVAGAARRAVDEARRRVVEGGETPSFEEVVDLARRALDDHQAALLRPVINATGVLVHTNLGRVPLGAEQLEAVAAVAGGYSNLEYSLAEGRRGSRYSHATELISALTGAEASLVVNNNAAAVLLILAGLCEGREVVISRGELIEIGGEFRIPEIMATSGARLIEVGTTNRTHIADYERAIGPNTAAILKVHPSNYRVVGFTASVPARHLARLSRGRGVCFIHDIGSGLATAPSGAPWSESEPPVDVALSEGADVVSFSGDKLLGGPQAGIIAGRASLIRRLSEHPLLRALRVDKMTLAALQATLQLHLQGRVESLPLWRMALAPLDELRSRADALAAALEHELGDSGFKTEAAPSSAVTGGGSLPGTELSSWAIALTHVSRGPDDLAAALRAARRPVVARVMDDRVLLDMRTVDPDDDDELRSLVVAALDS